VPEQETVKCQRFDEHDDMYPEFAPEPIVVRCEHEATVLWEDDSERGVAGMVVCTHHAIEQMTYTLAHHEEFSIRSLTTTDRKMYLAGQTYAEEQELTQRQALIAYNDCWIEAGLMTPEHSAQLFDIGWEWAMMRRCSEMIRDLG